MAKNKVIHALLAVGFVVALTVITGHSYELQEYTPAWQDLQDHTI